MAACPVVPPTRAVTDKVNHLLTLSHVCSEELDFRTTGHLTANEQGPGTRWYPHVLSSRYNPCAGTVGSPVGSGSYRQVQPGVVTLDGTLEMVRLIHQRNELKRNILVSPRWC